MSSRSSEENRIKALENISAAMLLQAMLPDRVFSGAWRYFRLCMSDDYIFTRRFVRAVHAFLLVEGSSVACMWNLREEDGMPTVFSFDAATTPMDFHDVLSGSNEDFRNWAFRISPPLSLNRLGPGRMQAMLAGPPWWKGLLAACDRGRFSRLPGWAGRLAG